MSNVDNTEALKALGFESPAEELREEGERLIEKLKQKTTLINYLTCTSFAGNLDVGLSNNKRYKELAKHKDIVAIVNDYDDLKLYSVINFK